MDDHGESGSDGFAVAIADAVLEHLGQLVRIGAQGLNRSVAVVHHVAVVALGIEYQAAVGAGQGLAWRAGDAVGVDHGADKQGVAIRVAVRAADTAAWVQARLAVVDPTGLDGIDRDRVDHGRVVDASDHDHQLRLIGQAAAVVDLVGKDHVQALPGR